MKPSEPCVVHLHSAHCKTFMKQPVLFLWSWDLKVLFHLSFSGKLGHRGGNSMTLCGAPTFGCCVMPAESHRLLKMSTHWLPKRVSLLRPAFFSVSPE